MADDGADRGLIGLVLAIGLGDDHGASGRLAVEPALARARLGRDEEFFLPECHAQLYEGDTALHAAAFAYSSPLVRTLLAAGADVRARNRRGAEPLHAAVIGAPGSSNWNPTRQTAVIIELIEAGAVPDATATGGVTALHRAVRNRCSAAVETLLNAGADPHRQNDNGSTALTLARWTTGRSGSGSPEAQREQQIIIRLLTEGDDGSTAGRIAT